MSPGFQGRTLRVVWASTEDLGAWPVARKRLEDALSAFISTPLASADPEDLFAPMAPLEEETAGSSNYFVELAEGFTTATHVAFSREHPARVTWGQGDYSWPLREQSTQEEDAILFPRRLALNDDGQPVALAELAARADGRAQWGVLVGDVDQFETLLKHAGTVEDHIHLSILFKEFFAGELSLLCTLPDFWRKVTVLYRGGDDFAVLGSWDALLLLARELQRLFEKFAEHNLQSGTGGAEGKTISMVLALAPENDAELAQLYASAERQLRESKTVEPGTVHLFGRTLEWKRLNDAEDLKSNLVRLVKDFGYPASYILDLTAVYRETSPARSSRRKTPRMDKPWRTYMRLARVIPQARGKELNNLRTSVISSLIGKRTANLKLRPSGRVGLEWARLSTDTNS
jgi:CRISPR-associated protein Csm1